jgi:hypothetical protein
VGPSLVLLDDGSYEPQAVNVPIDTFLNIHAGIQGDDAVDNDEDGEMVDPFGLWQRSDRHYLVRS